MQHIRIISFFCLFGGGVGVGVLFSFPVPGRIEKIAGLWFAKGDQYPG